MADKDTVILQRGTVPTVNARGVRTASRPMTDADRSPPAPSVFGGLAGAAESSLSGRKDQVDNSIKQQTDGMAKGGIVKNAPKTSTAPGDRGLNDAGKDQKTPPTPYPKVGNTVPSTGGYKAGGMVRRGYGKARGA